MASYELREQLLTLEMSLHRAEVRRSRLMLERLLAPDFTEFARSGRVYDRRSIIDYLLNEDAALTAVLPQVSDVGCTALSADCILLTYRTSRVVAGSLIETLRSSIWNHREDEWVMVFHQATPT